MRRVSTDARPVRATEQLEWPRVAAFLRQHLPTDQIPGLDLSCEMEVEQFHGGHSNLTYLVRYGDVELVVRRPPFGPLPPTAHDVAREYRWLSAMHPVFPLAPKPYALMRRHRRRRRAVLRDGTAPGHRRQN